MSPVPVLWVCGAPGAGKSATAWAVFQQLIAAGIRTAYVDVDQLGMLYPEDGDDPDRYGLKDSALHALNQVYATSGAQVVLVSGVIHPSRAPAFASHYAGRLRFCLLDPNSDVQRDRLQGRDGADADVGESLAEARELAESGFAHERLDTSALTVSQAARHLCTVARELSRAAPGLDERRSSPSSGTAPLVVVTGPRAVGTSSVGWGLASASWAAGIATGFADLGQLSFFGGAIDVDPPDHVDIVDSGVGLANLAALHERFSAHGATSVVVSAHLADSKEQLELRAHFPGAPVTVIRLRADDATFAGHIECRAVQAPARLAGDDLLGADPLHQRWITQRAIAHQRALDRSGDDDLTVDVSGRSSDSVVTDLLKRLA